jgi:anti-anti-sigma regulatory factor
MTAHLLSTGALNPGQELSGRLPGIEMRVGRAAGEVVVRLGSEAGLRQAGELTNALLGLSALRPPRVTLDLSGLNAVSCLTMGDLVTFRRGLVRAGSRVRLAGDLQEPVRAALGRTGLLALFDSPEEA